jgi:hypothetical protein
LAHADNSKLIRSLLVNELERIQAVGGWRGDMRTMRGLWYDLIKPVLSRLRRIGQRTNKGALVKWDGELSRGLGTLIKRDARVNDEPITYKALGIVDGSRSRRAPASYGLTVQSVNVIGARHPEIILFIEKETLYFITEKLAHYFGVSSLCGSGKPSIAASEDVVRRIATCGNFKKGTSLHLLTVSDYDPAGEEIAGAIHDQIKMLAKREGSPVRWQHLGVYPHHLSPEDLAKNAYTPASKGLLPWLKRGNGIGGKPLGLELDALGGQRIRAIFMNGLEKLIDPAPFLEDYRRACITQLAHKLLEPEFEERLERMRAQLAQAWGELRPLEPEPEDVFAWARQGESYINPLNDGVYGDPDELVSRAKGLL